VPQEKGQASSSFFLPKVMGFLKAPLTWVVYKYFRTHLLPLMNFLFSLTTYDIVGSVG